MGAAPTRNAVTFFGIKNRTELSSIVTISKVGYLSYVW